MTTETWLLYLGTVLVLMCTPGPSHLLMVSVSMSNGFHRSLATAAGDLTANAIQIGLAGFGLAVAITGTRHGLAIVKWAGVAYLLWIGSRQVAASFRPTGDASTVPTASPRLLWIRGFVTSASNPKAVVFFAALFPQFLNSQHALTPQIAILGTTYLLIDACFLATYGKGACWLVSRINSYHKAWVDRIAGLSIIGAAVLLGFRVNQRT